VLDGPPGHGLSLRRFMSEEETKIPDEPVSAPKARRSGASKTAKSAKSAKTKEAPKASANEEIMPEETGPVSKPDAQESDWPEPETPSAGNQQDRPKKKRRRKKGKGGQTKNPQADEAQSPLENPAADPSPSRPPQPSKAQERSSIDPQLLAKRAWKIYLAEVSEEGVALIGDNDAKDLARRCFRLAEIFIEEQSRRR